MKSVSNTSRDVNNRALFNKRDKVCPLEKMPASEIDYKNPNFLRKYVSERGRMLPRRITSISAKKQRMLKNAIKRARVLALLPYSAKD